MVIDVRCTAPSDYIGEVTEEGAILYNQTITVTCHGYYSFETVCKEPVRKSAVGVWSPPAVCGEN